MSSIPTITVRNADLRTVPMPDLRSPEARALDATLRALDIRTYDERADARLARIEAAIERIADKLLVLWMEREACHD